ncbi:MAG: NAD(P)-binding protein, partial [Bacteroidetes bacterium]|nr:NAD(P)-binding protein [Bacteroidota bacterium]
MQVPSTSSSPSYDAIVVGGGPGGATTAAVMARDGLRVLLVDKDTFPRDKICGDAVGGKSFSVMERLGLLPHLQAAEQTGSWGVTFTGPYGDAVSIPFTTDTERTVPP